MTRPGETPARGTSSLEAPRAPGVDDRRRPIELWGGVECTVNRVGDDWFGQLERSGHSDRDDDLERFAALGIRTLRYPVLWERTAPDGLATADWRFADRRLPDLRRLGIAPIVGLLHHGSGPPHTHLLDPGFADALAAFAGAVAARYPWVKDWTPINEPLTTARFSALYGIWYPHACDDRAFVTAVLNQCRGTVLAMRAVRAVNPRARLIQTDDLGRTWGTEPLADTVAFYNERRWLAWDLLCGRVDRDHPLFGYLIESGASVEALDWFIDNRCPPEVIGINHYVTSDRWLDHRVARYPPACRAGADETGFVDIESVRVLAHPVPGVAPLLGEAWARYRIPLAVTEAHIDARREDQLRWLLDVWRGAESAREAGADVRAVTTWALLGAFDWNCLSRQCSGYYESGAFDLRAPQPRPTAMVPMIRQLAAGRTPCHPVLQGDGWWRSPDRFVCAPISLASAVTQLAEYRAHREPGSARPILISGASGTLGQAFAALCRQRNLAFLLLDRSAMDIADADAVAAALARCKPWAVINASGYVRIDAAERDAERCFRENTLGPRVLAEQCARAGIALLTFSSDQVFDGSKSTPWLESDTPAPLNRYGASKLAAEEAVLTAHPGAMVVRTSAFFGPWDRHNFVFHALAALARGEPFQAAEDVRVSPTYVPDLVHTCLDLLIDGESGIWHLANRGDVSWAGLARQAAALASLDPSPLRGFSGEPPGSLARQPRYAVLGSARAALMPPLEDALARFLCEQRTLAVFNEDGAPALAARTA